MQFNPDNKIIQLCAKGMEMESKEPNKARDLFLQAWSIAESNIEKFTAAHYVARHQTSTEDKLQWDKTALEFALKIDEKNMEANYPSLYLNIAKCYEDLKDFNNAQKNYVSALSFENSLPDDGYGNMIKSGIRNGIERISKL